MRDPQAANRQPTRSLRPDTESSRPLAGALAIAVWAVMLSVPAWAQQAIVITQPADDTVIVSQDINGGSVQVRIEGTFFAQGWTAADKVEVTTTRLDAPNVDRREATVTAFAGGSGRWVLERLPLKVGKVTMIRARIPGASDRRTVVTVPPRFSPHRQKVAISWRPDTEPLLARIGAKTLKNPPADPSQFTADVRRKVMELMTARLNGFGFEFIAGGDPQAHRLVFHEIANGYLGFTGPEHLDCWSNTQEGESTIHVGTLAKRILSDFECPDGPRRWRPMACGDTVEMRATDLAHSLAATAVHELLHGVGLVSCSWLAGDDNHNNPAPFFDLVNLFGNGEYLMDHGATVPQFRRIAETSSAIRGPRRVRELSTFNRSYLRLAHPPH